MGTATVPDGDFAYEPAGVTGRLRLSVSIFADRAPVRDCLREDAGAAGMTVVRCGPLADLFEGGADGPADSEVRSLGDVVLIDCPTLDPARMATLARLDMRAARSGARLVVSTTIAMLDDVFGCCDQSAPQLLVDPSRADRVLALGRVLADLPSLRVRELGEGDRLSLLRLTEQVARIAERLDGLAAGSLTSGASGFRLESPEAQFDAASVPVERLAFGAGPPLPEPQLVRKIIRQRQSRARFFDGGLFADPAWDMLLDLTAARAERARVSVTSLCIASGVPPTTALRWIGQMTQAGLLERVGDECDRRRAFIALSDSAAEAMARFFAQIDQRTAVLV